MLLTFIVVTFAAAASGQGNRCCMPTKWSGYMSDMRVVAGGQNVSSQFNYDYDNKAIAIQFFRFGGPGGIEPTNRVVTKYGQGTRYSIKTDGSCTSETLVGEDMLANCLPDDAVYLGSNYVGLNGTGVQYDAWNVPLGQLKLTLLLSNPGCVILTEGVVGSVTSGPVDTSYIFSGFRPSIPDQSVFNVPSGC